MVYLLKMVDLSMAMLNNQMVTKNLQKIYRKSTENSQNHSFYTINSWRFPVCVP